MIDFTVAIRTYNSEENLPDLLESLRQQVDTQNINWEIIVVDNNSSDNTAQIVRKYQNNWRQHYPLKYYFEEQPGAAFARQRAIREAQGVLIGFLDDDNLPTPNWVSSSYFFAQSYPHAVAYSGKILGMFEVKPPKGFERIQSFLALKERGDKPNLYDPDSLSLPPGAGLVIRKDAWLRYVPENLKLQGPVGTSLSAKGEDFEALLYLKNAGEIWYNPELVIYHKIPAWRLERDYLIDLIHQVGLRVCQLRITNAAPWQKPLIVARILLGNLRRVIFHLIKYRFQVKTDLVIACELEFFLSSFLSPFYLLKNIRLS